MEIDVVSKDGDRVSFFLIVGDSQIAISVVVYHPTTFCYLTLLEAVAL